MSEVEQLAVRLEEEADYDIHHLTKYALRQAAAELRRLAAVEKELEALKRAISDAELVGYVTPETVTLLKTFKEEDWCTIWNRETTKLTVPLYTLKGIK